MLRVKQYNMNDKYIDITAIFPKDVYGPKLPSYGPDLPDNMKKDSYWNEIAQDEKMELNKMRSIQRTKTKVKRYVIHKNMRYMWTLTFAKKYTPVVNSKGQKIYDAGSLQDAWHIWKMFLKRCARVGLKFDYIATIEVQEERLKKFGEKVFHFHFATNVNIPINQDFAKRSGKGYSMNSLWKHGIVNVQKQKSKKKFANVYLMKYITKMFDESSKGSQRYRCSEGMFIPTEIKFFNTEQELDIYVRKLANVNGCRIFKDYFPLSDGHNEVLFYGITPI